jgi:hypothetical protein
MANTLDKAFNIKEFYTRLGLIGLDKASIKKSLLPDWWCDEFEKEQGAMVEAAAYIARRTNLDFHDLLNPAKDLLFNSGSKPCYKLRQGTEESSLTISRAIAERLCEAVAFGASNSLRALPLNAQAIRSQIMQNHKFVTLEGLLEFCWDYGIAVIHAGNIPKGKNGRKFDGMVGIYGDRPIILIANNSKSHAKLAFILAHELGHIVCDHLQGGSSILDESIKPDMEKDDQEVQADEFAVELIYGKKNACYKDISKSLVVFYSQYYSEMPKVNPAAIALNWAWYQEKLAVTKEEEKEIWEITGAALKKLEDQKVSASQIINTFLQQKLDWDSLGNDSQEFIERMAGIE